MFQPQAPFPLGISIRNLTRCFDGRISVLSGLSLEIDSGEFVSLLGPSGCGKSTLLRLIAGLDRPDGGEIDFRADNNHASRRFDVRSASIAYVFQDPHLMPWRTVLTNVALPLELRGVG
ncbi:MAG TPA: ATP-binding cassette domain-containing protein, partial [Tepidisphaeraceae bacterium]